MTTTPELNQFPLKTKDKIRYADTDRQGHVNNAVFSTFLETGRTEFLYNKENPLTAPGCAFVIVNLNLNYKAEITWPGEVQIGTRVAGIGRSSVTFEQAIFKDGVCNATAKTVVVQMNERTRKSQKLQPEAIQHLEQYR